MTSVLGGVTFLHPGDGSGVSTALVVAVVVALVASPFALGLALRRADRRRDRRPSRGAASRGSAVVGAPGTPWSTWPPALRVAVLVGAALVGWGLAVLVT